MAAPAVNPVNAPRSSPPPASPPSPAPLPRPRSQPSRLDRRLHRSYRQFHAVRGWLERHVTPTGALVFWLMVASASFIDVGQTTSHHLVALLLALNLGALLFLFRPAPRLVLHRVAPRHATVGTPMAYTIAVSNPRRRRVHGIELRERLADPRPTLAEFSTLAEPLEHRRNWFDRRYRFYRWQWLCQRNTRAVPLPVAVPDLPPGGRAEIRAELVPLRRGRLVLGDTETIRLDPFGLFRALGVQPTNASSIVIFPRRFRLPAAPLPGSHHRLQSGGVALAGPIGESEEFVSVREYRPGDPLRRLHWAGWARTQKPVVKEYQEEFFIRHALVLDTYGDGPESEAFEDAVSLAASFACTVDQSETLLDLMFVGDQAYVFTAGRGIAHSSQMLEVLAGVELRPDVSPEDLESLLLRHVTQVSGCAVILLHWDPPRQRLLQQLTLRRIPTVTFIVRDEPRPPDLALPSRTYWVQTGQVEAQLPRDAL